VSRILVPLDESPLAEEALPVAGAIARAFGDTVHLVSVWTHDEQMWERAGVKADDKPQQIAQALDRYLAEAAQQPDFAGVTVTYESTIGDPGDRLREMAGEGETRLVVMTSHGKGGFKRMVQGSVSDELVRTAKVPVLVVRSGAARTGLHRVLVALDGSETGETALPIARELARAAGAEVHLLRVLNPVSEVTWTGVGPAPDLAQVTEQLSASARDYLAGKALEGEHWDVLYGRPLDGILQYVDDHHCDVIVIGSRGRGGFARLALGSTADAVVRSADVPVLVVPASDRES
jgi:nucleotide-binding universal stress UspA family protein